MRRSGWLRRLFGGRRVVVWVLLGMVAGALVAATAAGAYWYRQYPSRCWSRAVRALQEGRLTEVARYADALEGHPDYQAHQHFLRGALLLEKNQLYRALEEFGHAVGHPELRRVALTLSGEAAYLAGHWLDAVGLLEQALQLDPQAVDALRWLASAYYDLGLNQPTLDCLARIAELDPADARAPRLMGLIYKDFEKYALAVEHYRESLRRDPYQVDRNRILLEWADSHIKLRQFDRALEVLTGCEPSAERWVREAECHYRLGRTEPALQWLERALVVEPANLAALLLKGTIALETGKPEHAVEALSRAVTAYPKDYTARFKLAQAYRRAGNDEQFAKHSKIAEEIKQVREEFSRLHERIAAEPGNADIRCRLGVLARQLDRPDLARLWFRAALAIDPRHAEAIRQLAGEPRTFGRGIFSEKQPDAKRPF